MSDETEKSRDALAEEVKTLGDALKETLQCLRSEIETHNVCVSDYCAVIHKGESALGEKTTSLSKYEFKKAGFSPDRVIAKERDALAEKVAALEAENAELTQTLRMRTRGCNARSEYIQELKFENAELRKFAKYIRALYGDKVIIVDKASTALAKYNAEKVPYDAE